MKKFIIALIAVFALSTAAMAQGNSEKFAIGARLGGAYGYGMEASFHIGGLPNLNRVELDLGYHWWHYGGFGLYGIYHWRWNIVAGLHWYVGPGVGVNTWFHAYNPVSVAVGGQIGIEYNFDFPLQLSFDVRPMFGIISPWDNTTLWPDVSAALGVRYRF